MCMYVCIYIYVVVIVIMIIVMISLLLSAPRDGEPWVMRRHRGDLWPR